MKAAGVVWGFHCGFGADIELLGAFVSSGWRLCMHRISCAI